MRRIVLVLTAGFSLLLSFGPVSSVLPVVVGPNSPDTNPNGDTRAVGWASHNWSGYAINAQPPYHDITGQWTVPLVTACSARGRISACYSAAWVGIDGFQTTSTLIQTGTEQDFIDNTASYSAWWTTSDNGFIEQPIGSGDCSSDPNTNCGTVAAGDPMSAHIGQTSGTSWAITLQDTSKGWTFTMPVTYNGTGGSAEWIMEAPRVIHTATLPTYGDFTFDPDTVKGGNPGLTANDGGELIQKGKVVSIPSDPDIDTDGFTMHYTGP